MNSIMMVIAAVIAILLVFIIFSQNEQDEEGPEKLQSQDKEDASEKSDFGSSNLAEEKATGYPASTGTGAQETAVESHPVAEKSMKKPDPGPEIGSEEDLKFRLQLDDQLPLPTHAKTQNAVAAVVQIRFPETFLTEAENASLVQMLGTIEGLLDSDHSPFPYSVYLANQTDRLLLFGFDEERDDAVFESLVTAYDLVSRFKKTLEKDDRLLQAKARLSIGLSCGPITRILRGSIGPVSHAGKPVYLAEVLAEAAGDFQIYVDEEMYRLSMPLFDFREWKPMKLRPPLPPVAFFEVVGWNKKEEIFAFASHQEVFARRAVAVAYRYLDFDDLAPLLGLLSDADEKVALEALTTISEIGDERALGILKKILPEARNPVLRSFVIEAMGRVGKEGILPVLLASTKDVNWQVRLQAVRALFRVAGVESFKHIEHLVHDDDGGVRAVIHQIFYQQYKLEKDLLGLRDLLTDLSHRARKHAIEALVTIGTNPAILMIARSYPDQEPDYKRLILRHLTRAKSNVVYQCFLEIFQKADEKDRSEIVSALRRARLTT